MILFLSIVKALVEVAGMALLGQFVVAMFNPSRRQQNPVYQLLGVLTGPVNKTVRLITPKVAVDEHVPFVSFFFLLLLWFCAVVGKVYFLKVVPA
jgi:uncharacterized protein YggT (Ycf19 family)